MHTDILPLLSHPHILWQEVAFGPTGIDSIETYQGFAMLPLQVCCAVQKLYAEAAQLDSFGIPTEARAKRKEAVKLLEMYNLYSAAPVSRVW